MLAIDLGTSGAKAAVVSLPGQVLGAGRVPVETIHLPDDGAEQDPEKDTAASWHPSDRSMPNNPAPAQRGSGGRTRTPMWTLPRLPGRTVSTVDESSWDKTSRTASMRSGVSTGVPP